MPAQPFMIYFSITRCTMMNRAERLECLESKLELICKQIAETSFKINSMDFDFYNETNYYATALRELADELQNTNDDICDILDYYFDQTGEYPVTKHY